MAAEITQDVPLPSRSRTFSTDDANAVLRMLSGTPAVEAVPAHKDDDGNDVPAVEASEAVPPAKNVGFGSFSTAGAARSAGVTLNRMLGELGAPHKYAVTTRERDGKVVGVLLNKPAKEKKDAEPVKAATPPPAARKAATSAKRGR